MVVKIKLFERWKEEIIMCQMSEISTPIE